jgi:hypothetical protein
MQARIQGTLTRDAQYGFAIANGDNTTPVTWPHGYVAREGAEGLELLNAAGEVAAREGDVIQLGGGQGGEMWIACPGPEVIPEELAGRLEGDPKLEDGCIWLKTDMGRRWPIHWPDGYREEFRDGQPVLLHDDEVVAEAGDRISVRGGAGQFGYACIGFNPYTAAEVVAINPVERNEPSAEPSAAVTHVPRKSMSFALPSGWTHRLPDPILEWGMGPTVIYFSNQPMHDECERTEDEHGISTTCSLPIDALVPDGVLIEWWVIAYYWVQSPPPLPDGTPYDLAGVAAVRKVVDTDECQQLGATEAERITLRRSAPSLEHLRICARDPSAQTRAELEALLQSIVFDDAAIVIPTQEPPPVSDSPLPCAASLIVGTLVRDETYGVVVDTGEQRIPVVWPHGYYAREGPDGVEVVDREGGVRAVEGEEVELGGGMNAADDQFLTCNR